MPRPLPLLALIALGGALAGCTVGPQDASKDAAPVIDAAPDAIDAPPPGPLVFVLAGESNSGGIALNSEATEAELAPRPSVQIMDLYSGAFGFEPLDIGYNNLVDHEGLSNNTTYVPSLHDIRIHGMELGLANAVEAGAFPGVTSVYLIKTGHGGSRIDQWGVGGTYWTKFLQRTDAAKLALPADARWVVWYSQGINDAIAGVPIAAWKAGTVAHIAKVRAQLPGCQFIFTEFQSMPANAGYPAVNAAIRELIAADPTLTSVDTTGAATDGANHWSYAGYRNVVVPAMVAATHR